MKFIVYFLIHVALMNSLIQGFSGQYFEKLEKKLASNAHEQFKGLSSSSIIAPQSDYASRLKLILKKASAKEEEQESKRRAQHEKEAVAYRNYLAARIPGSFGKDFLPNRY